MAYGVTAEGFALKPLSVTKAELEAALRAVFGASIDLASTSNWGQLVGILSERETLLWELAEACYGGFDPDQVEGAAQDALCALTGTVRAPGAPSTVTLVCAGAVGTVLAIGRQASVATIGTRFETIAAATLGAAVAWATSTAYAIGNIRTANGNIYVCVIAGTSASSGTGPSHTSGTAADGTATWLYVGAGTGSALVLAESVEDGPKVAATGTLTEIETPVSGWNGVANYADAVLGVLEETDAALRIRRENELLGASLSTMASIRVRVGADVEGVTKVIVFQNDTEATNGDGMPPHSVEVLVRGGVAQEIADAVFENVAAGITTHGNQTSTVTDTENGGQTYTVKWSRPVEKLVYVTANILVDATVFPADGAQQVEDAILARGAAFEVGLDVRANYLRAACFSVAGVLDVTNLYIGLSASPAAETTITNTLRELALFDSARTIVNVSTGTP